MCLHGRTFLEMHTKIMAGIRSLISNVDISMASHYNES